MTEQSILANVGSLHLGAILFAIILSVFWIHSFFIEYHLIRFGIGNSPKYLSLVTMVGSFLLSIAAAILFFNMNL